MKDYYAKYRHKLDEDLCLVPDCIKKCYSVNYGIHTHFYLCENHFEYALGFFQRTAGCHPMEYEDVIYWIETKNMIYYPQNCSIFACIHPLNHEGEHQFLSQKDWETVVDAKTRELEIEELVKEYSQK